jgi:hypothetical protein
MPRQPKTRRQSLTFAQACMTANFYDAACDYRNESFESITRRMVGTKGFPQTKNVESFKSECRKAFDMGRR